VRQVPRYFLHLPEDSAPRRWDPFAGPRPERKDTGYWGGVFRAMQPALSDGAIDVYLTYDVQRLPRYGDDVVAVVLGDEVGRVPRYLDHVLAVFKCYGRRPALGSGPLRNPAPAGLAELAQYGVRWLRWLPSGAAGARSRLRTALGGDRRAAPLFTVPLGTFNQQELPIVPPEDRPIDLSFAGSVEHRAAISDRLLSPKARSRREMLAAVEQLSASAPQLRIDLRLTQYFEGSESASAAAYSRALMDARICLAPRGTSVETFRLLEGLRYGCVVVSGRLPRHWFYDGGPFLELDRWRDLQATVMPLLEDRAALARAHEAALSWWRERCSENAVGRFLAERLNDLSAGG
jgi:hypothetical protein